MARPSLFDSDSKFGYTTLDIQTYINRINDETYKIPAYQRSDGAWDVEMKNKLIDSIFKGLYVPPIILLKNEDGNQYLIDGLQRTTTIKDYIENKFGYVPINIIDSQPGEIMNKSYYYSKLPETKNANFDILSDSDRKTFNLCKFYIAESDSRKFTEQQSKEIFLRLQLNVKLTTGDIMNVYTHPIIDLCKRIIDKHTSKYPITSVENNSSLKVFYITAVPKKNNALLGHMISTMLIYLGVKKLRFGSEHKTLLEALNAINLSSQEIQGLGDTFEKALEFHSKKNVQSTICEKWNIDYNKDIKNINPSMINKRSIIFMFFMIHPTDDLQLIKKIMVCITKEMEKTRYIGERSKYVQLIKDRIKKYYDDMKEGSI